MKTNLLKATALTTLLATAPLPALADAETEALRAQIKLLEARLDQLEKKQIKQAPATSYGEYKPSAGGSKKLEDRVAIVERKQELAEEDNKAKAEKNAKVEMSNKGLSVTSADKQFSAKLNGYFQVDNRTFTSGGAKGDDEFLARRLRPILTLQAYKDFQFRLLADFAGATTRVFDAHADYRHTDALQFRLGKFKPPIGLERMQSAADSFFTERGHPNNLVPARDFGFMIHGEPMPEIEYQLGVFNGNTDLSSADSDDDNHKDIAARIFTHPFRNSATLALQGLGFGVGGSYGKRGGTTATPILPEYKTPGQKTFFSYTSGAFADGAHWRATPQAYYYNNNYGLLAEYNFSTQDVTRLGVSERLQHKAWQVAGSYVITGEDVNYKGSVKPENNFDAKNGWGAFEVVARVGETDVDNDAFGQFASITTSASRARSYGGGLNWYLNENFKLMLDYEHTVFDGGAAIGNRADEDVIIGRSQFRF